METKEKCFFCSGEHDVVYTPCDPNECGYCAAMSAWYAHTKAVNARLVQRKRSTNAERASRYRSKKGPLQKALDAAKKRRLRPISQRKRGVIKPGAAVEYLFRTGLRSGTVKRVIDKLFVLEDRGNTVVKYREEIRIKRK